MNSMSEQLIKIKDELDVVKDRDITFSPNVWKEDGVDHINIWEHGKTELGIFLSHGSKYPLHHKLFGNFKNVESFWKYVQSKEKDDRVRFLSGPSLRRFSKKLSNIRVKNFRAIIVDATYQKLLNNEKFLKQMKESTLPFDCYYIAGDSKIKVRPIFTWVINGMEEIRLALKEDREPDFTFLKDRKNISIYDHVLEQVKNTSLPE